MLRGRVGVLRHIAGLREQVGAVAQRGHIEGVSGKLFLGHHVDRHMGQIEIFQRHIANVVVIRHLVSVRVGVALLVRPSVGFRPIPHLNLHLLGQNVLAVKEVLERTLYLVHRPRPLMERGDHRDQHIGVVFNVIKVKMVFIVIVGGLVAVEVVLQFSLQLTIGGLGP